MKRDRYASELDRVMRERRLANMEFFDPDEPAEAQAAARVEASRQDFHERMRQREEAQSALEAEAKAKHDAKMRDFDRKVKLREYAALGLTPPEPLVSLDLLKSIGWRVERISYFGEDRWELIRPSWLAPKQGKDNDDRRDFSGQRPDGDAQTEPEYSLTEWMSICAPIRSKSTAVPMCPIRHRAVGAYNIFCNKCKLRVAVTVAGRPDDPRTVTMPCKVGGLNA